MENRQMDSKSSRARPRWNQITWTFVQVCADNVQKKEKKFAYNDDEKTDTDSKIEMKKKRHHNMSRQFWNSIHRLTIFIPSMMCSPHLNPFRCKEFISFDREMSAVDERNFLVLCNVNKHDITKFNFICKIKVLNIWCASPLSYFSCSFRVYLFTFVISDFSLRFYILILKFLLRFWSPTKALINEWKLDLTMVSIFLCVFRLILYRKIFGKSERFCWTKKRCCDAN